MVGAAYVVGAAYDMCCSNHVVRCSYDVIRCPSYASTNDSDGSTNATATGATAADPINHHGDSDAGSSTDNHGPTNPDDHGADHGNADHDAATHGHGLAATDYHAGCHGDSVQ